jgi:tetratricopeptide (TPR) repeat protein
MNGFFDLISLIAIFACFQTLWQLSHNWSEFWDSKVTYLDREIAQKVVVFVLIPIGVLLHEIGHSLAIWQVGGTVLSFQWHFYWGYIIPSGNFSTLEDWWISLSGNLVSIISGLLPIPFIIRARQRIIGELLYFFACLELLNSLLIYPLISLGSMKGDWSRIYNFSIQPHAGLTLIIHVILIWGLWHLYHSQEVISWRLASNLNILSKWEELKDNIVVCKNDVTSHLKLAYFLIENNEIHSAKKIAKKIYQIAPYDLRTQTFRVVMNATGRAYHKAIKSGCKLLNTNDLAIEEQLRLYRVLCLCSYQTRRLPEALSFASQGLDVAPEDYKLRWHRAIVYRMMGKHQEEREDLDIALENAPDEDRRQKIQQYRKTR